MILHHLNCGTIRVPGGIALLGTGTFLTRAPGVTHCLLAETDDGLLLVDTGIGSRDCLSPTPFVRAMLALSGHPRDLAETALHQVRRLGYAVEDVRHIVLTHFHFDHTGGLPDFPCARVHISRDEYEAVTHPRDAYERYPYRHEHWRHGPEWEPHEWQSELWFGLRCSALTDLGRIRFCLVSLPGHTRGHAGVALRLDGDRWLLHCGDAYTFHGMVDSAVPRDPPHQRTWRQFLNLNRAMRPIGQHGAVLSALVREHGDQIELTCSHDPWDLDRLRSSRIA